MLTLHSSDFFSKKMKAMDEGKLFMLDYHDICLPFVDCINAMEGRKAYGTRTIFFLGPQGTLKPVAIELDLPPSQPGGPRPSKVLTPPCDATSHWLWMLAKAHVNSNDAGVHQLVNHWYRLQLISFQQFDYLVLCSIICFMFDGVSLMLVSVYD
jgi:lipoxygenase